MKHALFIAFHYPPESSSSGVLRTLKYSRYLLDSDWRITVIAPEITAYTETDDKLNKQIPEQVKVIRTPYFNTKQRLSIKGKYFSFMAIPDTWIGWYPWAVRAAKKLANDDPFELVYSTSPHATSHVIAKSIANNYQLPWVADFRDPWYEEPPEPGTTRIQHYFARKMEYYTVKRADHIVTTTQKMCDDYRHRYSDIPTEKFSCIPNGYDEADFNFNVLKDEPYNDQHISILHAGLVNGEFRDPRPLLLALKQLIKEEAIPQELFKIRFIGAGDYMNSPEIQSLISQPPLKQIVEILPRQPYAESIKSMLKADVLLLLQASTDTASLVPAKLYEYLRAGKPVLALAQPSAVTEILNSANGGWSIEPTNEQALKEVLLNIHKCWTESNLATYGASLEAAQQFDRKILTMKLAQIFDSLT